MKSLNIILAIAAGVLIVSGCSKFKSPTRSNPLDPENTAYQAPGAEIILGPVNDSIIGQTNTLYRWRGTGTASEFQYRMDSGTWSAWGVGDSAVCNYLDEGAHNFEIRARNQAGAVQAAPTAVGFMVDALTGPAMLVKPIRYVAAQGQSFTVDIMAEDVQSLCGADLVITYNSYYLTYNSCIVGSFWPSNGGTVLGPYFNNITGTVNASISLIQTTTGVSGSGSLAALNFTTKSFVGNTTITIAAQSSLRDTANNVINLTSTRNCMVVIQ